MQLLNKTFGYISLLVVLMTFDLANAEPISGTLVVVNKKADTVNFIDIASRTIKYTLPTGKGPHEVAITNDGKWAVVTNYDDGNSLTVFDVQQAKADAYNQPS